MRAGGVRALATAMKANTPVAADWAEGVRPAPTVDLADVQKEGCGLLNNLAACALGGSTAVVSALREAAMGPLLVSTIDAYASRPEVMHRVLPALAQLVALSTDVEETETVAAVVRCMQSSDANDVWIQCSGARVLHIVMQRGAAARHALLLGGAGAALSRALDAAPEKARKANGFGFDEGQLRQKLVAMGAPVLERLAALAQEAFAPGATGSLHGLGQRADLNGAPAEVLKPTTEELASLQSRGRVKVKADGEMLSVQYKNLVVDPV